MPDPSIEYRNKFLKRQLAYERKFRPIFNKVADQFAMLSGDPNAKFSKAFKYNGVINKKIDIIIEAFHKDTLDLTELEIEKSWGLSNEKNDLIVKNYISTISGIKAVQKASFFFPNIPALKAFISGTHGAETLSNSVWQVAKQVRQEMSLHLGIGIANGDSAQVISRRIRTYLNNPDALFRRIRDNKGRLVASQKMIEFRKTNGLTQGTYTSAYKNAMRLARTNTNTAYLLADNLRWAQEPMVIGIHIEISAQHKIYDICDECQGDYPKFFVWTGWHVLCLCHQTPILMPRDDFKDYLKGDQPLKAEQITEIPENFQKYMRSNFNRYSGYKNLPFFMQDNPGVIGNIMTNYKATTNVLSKSLSEKAIVNVGVLGKKCSEIAKMTGTNVTAVNIKSIGRITEKALSDYKGDVTQVGDAIRNTFIAERGKHAGLIEQISKSFNVQNIRYQNFSTGYTGTLINVKFANGSIGEIQINTAKMIYAKDSNALSFLGKDTFNKIAKETGQKSGLGHSMYEEIRGLNKRSDAFRIEQLTEKSKQYYSHFK